MVIYKGSNNKNEVAISFDDGPNPEITLKILQVLKDKNVKAIFFLIGKNAEKYPDIARQIVEGGHDIGDHTYTHQKLSGLLEDTSVSNNHQEAREAIIDEIKRGADVLKEIVGISDSELRYLRPPYLGLNTAVEELVSPFYGNRIIMSRTASDDWSWDYSRWSDESLIQAKSEEIFNDVATKIEPGAIIALHDSSEKGLPEHGQLANWEKRAIPTLKALPKIIDEIKHRGFSIVKLNQMELLEESLRISQ